MRLVLDTNVMVESITPESPYHKIYQSFYDDIHALAVSNEIILEYFEVFGRIYSERTFNEITTFFDHSPAISEVDPHYRFHLIHTDEDDNKFVDCAICGNCD